MQTLDHPANLKRRATAQRTGNGGQAHGAAERTAAFTAGSPSKTHGVMRKTIFLQII
jgi:hypothetical protein